MNPHLILALRDEVSVELADTPARLLEAYQLRYQIYCVERAFLTGQNGIEIDEFDGFSRHALIREGRTGTAVGTVRLVMSKLSGGDDNFPIQHLCDRTLLQNLPLAACGEVSRFTLAKQPRDLINSHSAVLRLALMKAVVMMSAEANHTHWLAVMEPTLLRLLAATGIHMIPLGSPVAYHGVRQPTFAEIVPTLARCAVEQPAVWDFITERGTWYPDSGRRLAQ